MASSLDNKISLIFLLCSIIGVLILSSCPKSAHSQILKRYELIKEWAEREDAIFSLCKARVKRLKQELSELEKFVEDYEKSTLHHLSGLQDGRQQENVKDVTSEGSRGEIVASNAILTYRMAHRLSTMIPRMQRATLAIDPEGLQLKVMLGAFTNVEHHPNVTFDSIGEDFGLYSAWLPSEDDLEGALDSIVILYDAYNPEVLKAEDFTKMLSVGTTNPIEINAYHATKFSLKAFYHGYYGNAMDWANYANTKLDKDRDYSISKELVHYMREFMGKSHNEEFTRPSSYFPETISYLNFFTEMVNETKTWEKRKTQVYRMARLGQDISDENIDEKLFQQTTSYYYAACQKARLEVATPSEPKPRYSCGFNRNLNPYYYLAPLKVETISESPRILQFHDVLLPAQLEKLLEEVRGLQYSSPYPLKEFPDEYGTRKPHLKTSVDGIIDKEWVKQGGNSGILSVLARKTEYLTGFKILSDGYGVSYPGEELSDFGFRVTEFVGGGYEAIQSKMEGPDAGVFGSGIQIYLHIPEEGGEVIFGATKRIVKPTKGSAIFWENIGSDSIVPVELYLGACPVVQGYKIVVSKEFSYSMEQMTYPDF